jgi:hypothetical protein
MKMKTIFLGLLLATLIGCQRTAPIQQADTTVRVDTTISHDTTHK